MQLDTFEQKAWDLLADSIQDRHSPLRTLSLVTLSKGKPKVRGLILRAIDPEELYLELHTDVRSGKWEQVSTDPSCALLGWYPEEKLQIRIEGRARCFHKDEMAQAAWSQLPLPSRLSYSSTLSPGTRITSAEIGQKAYTAYARLDQLDTDPWQANFGLIRVSISEMELLKIGREGHWRATYGYQGGYPAREASWLVP